MEFEAKDTVNVVQEIKARGDFLFNLAQVKGQSALVSCFVKYIYCMYLVLSAENVGIILLEAAHTGKTGQCTREFVAVQDTKVSKANGQITVTAVSMTKHQTVTRAVHRLQSKFFLIDFQAEHVLLVLCGVAGLMPQLEVVHVRGDDFVESTHTVFLLD